MEKLIRGAAEFNLNPDPALKAEMTRLAIHGQSPGTLLITCVDSRILPSIITNATHGEILTLRNVGNIVPSAKDSASGADASVASTISFAMESLKITDIVVMGHSECGGMAELHARRDDFRADALGTWLRNGRGSLARFLAEEQAGQGLSDINRLSQLNVLNSLESLASYPEVRARLDRMELTLHGWWFDIGSATTFAFEPRAGRFVPVEVAYEATVGPSAPSAG